MLKENVKLLLSVLGFVLFTIVFFRIVCTIMDPSEGMYFKHSPGEVQYFRPIEEKEYLVDEISAIVFEMKDQTPHSEFRSLEDLERYLDTTSRRLIDFKGYYKVPFGNFVTDTTPFKDMFNNVIEFGAVIKETPKGYYRAEIINDFSKEVKYLYYSEEPTKEQVKKDGRLGITVMNQMDSKKKYVLRADRKPLFIELRYPKHKEHIFFSTTEYEYESYYYDGNNLERTH